jgi:hypothetical protein
VPPELWDVTFSINQDESTANALAGLFGEQNENIIVNALLTDTNDWSVHWDSSLVNSVEVRYLAGSRSCSSPTCRTQGNSSSATNCNLRAGSSSAPR